MRIQQLTILAGPDGTRSPGEVWDAPGELAKQLIDGGYAAKAPSKVAEVSEPLDAAADAGAADAGGEAPKPRRRRSPR